MNALVGIIPLSTLLYVAALFIYLMSVKRVTIFSFVFIGVLILEVLHIGLEFFLLSGIADSVSDLWLFNAWYLGFAGTDFLFIACVLFWAKEVKIRLDHVSKAVLYLHGLLGCLQISRLLDRLLIDSDFMAVVYLQGVQVLNMLIAFILLGFVSTVIFQNSQQGYGR